MQAEGKIANLRTQVRCVLIPAQWTTEPRTGKRGQPLKPRRRCAERSCVYVADFVYTLNGTTVVEDAKSPAMRTPEYVIKRKLMLYIHGIHIKEV